MCVNPQIGVSFLTGEAFETPTPDNTNWLLTTEDTPAGIPQRGGAFRVILRYQVDVQSHALSTSRANSAVIHCPSFARKPMRFALRYWTG